MMPKTKTRIVLDFENQRSETYEKVKQIICSSHWGSGIDIYGFLNDNHSLLFDLLIKGAIVIDECEYEIQEQCADSETARLMKTMLGKRSRHPVIGEMAILFGEQPFEPSVRFRNALYFPSLKAFMRADGMKPEDVTEMLVLDDCDKIILFPYYPIDEKTAYYELTLAVPKESFVKFMQHIEQQKMSRLYEAMIEANKRNTAGYKSILRTTKKTDWKTVEQLTYRAFQTAEHADGTEALLAHKLRSCNSFVPQLDFIAELDGKIIGNIMYTKSKVVKDSGEEWETLTFGPLSVLPKYQRDGVGSALIRKTLDVAKEMGFRAVLIFGHETYYPRFGFKPASEYKITTADGKNFPAFMALPLYDDALDDVSGRFICDDIFFTLDRDESDKLNAKLTEPMDIDEYIDTQQSYYQPFLRQVRGTIRAALPHATEKISWQMPTFWDGCNLIHFAAFKNHIGIYPGPAAVEHFKPRLTKYKTSKGGIQFSYQNLSGETLSLIAEIADLCGENNKK